MRIGIISDIHSNILAFRAAMEQLEALACDEYFLLGDYVSDTPYTKETMEYLYRILDTHTCYILRGNREEYMLTQRSNLRAGNTSELWSFNSASGNLLFSYQQLTEKDLDFFENLPITFVYEKEGLPSITCCHGSPDSTRELLQFYCDNTPRWLDKIDTPYLICAHTHYQGTLVHHGRWYMNPGCIGIAINDAGIAQCMYIDAVEEVGEMIWKPTFLRVPYDNRQVARDMVESGLLNAAVWFVNSNLETILTGRDQASPMVGLAGELAGESAKWPNIDECYFEEAAKRLEIPDYRREGIFLEYRLGIKQDVQDICDLINDAVVRMESQNIYQWDELYPTKEDFETDIEKKTLYVAKEGGELVGFYVISDECDEAYQNADWMNPGEKAFILHRFCISPHCQNRGYGKRILNHIEEQIKAMGYESVRLDVFTENPFAQSLYRHNGYEARGFADWRKGRFDLMEKKL